MELAQNVVTRARDCHAPIHQKNVVNIDTGCMDIWIPMIVADRIDAIPAPNDPYLSPVQF
jgi:hypothetical protein